MPHGITRYAIYTRQSVESSDKSLSSCEVQFSICQDFMRNRVGPYSEWVGERLDDDGHSGATLKRPAVKRLMALVESRLVDQVVIYRLDRLTRSLRDSVDVFEAFRTAGVELLIVTAPELASSASDHLMLNLMGVFAEFERDMIRSRLADTRAALRQRGRRLAGKVPYGYDADPVTKQLVVNRLEAGHVRRIFRLAAAGTLPKEIAALANKRGWRTKITVAQRSGRISGGGAWTPRQILDLLANPVYTGVFAQGTKTRPGNHEAIVTDQDFESAGREIAKRRTTKASRHVSTTSWPLRGKIICPFCRRKMSPHRMHRGNIVYLHYRCRSHAGGRPPCKKSALPAHEFECAVANWISSQPPRLSPPHATQDHAIRLEQFLSAWKMLDSFSQRCLLPEIVRSVTFARDWSSLRVEFDPEAIAQVGS